MRTNVLLMHHFQILSQNLKKDFGMSERSGRFRNRWKRFYVSCLCLWAIWFSVGLINGDTPDGRFVLQPANAAAEPLTLQKDIDTLVTGLTTSARQRKIGKLAVFDFVGPGDRITELGEYISNRISVALVLSGAFPDVMERKKLKELLLEIQKGKSDLVDPDTAPRFGRIIGVNSMVVGTVTDLGEAVSVTAKIVQTETGRILGASEVYLNKDDNIKELIGKSRTAKLTIKVNPPADGTVVVCEKNGVLQNGMISLVNIPYGDCQVIIQVPGYAPVHKRVEIRSPFETLSVKLIRKRYEVSFQVVPPDASLTVDGTPVTLSPQGFARVSDLKLKEYSYVVQAKGYQAKLGRFHPIRDAIITLDLVTDDPFYETKNKFYQKVLFAAKKSDFGVQLWTNEKTFRLGDAIYFYFKAEKDCYLNLVDITSDGEIRLILPNRFHPDNYVKGGVVYRIPDEKDRFAFEAQPPLGVDRIYAIASTRPVELFNHDFGQDEFYSLTRGSNQEDKVRDIGFKLDQIKLSAAAECIIFIK